MLGSARTFEEVAIDGIGAASHPHHFLSVTKYGHSAIVATLGNKDCHVILRGGTEPNYSSADVADAAAQLEAAGLTPRVMVDFSHANSAKQFKRQMDVGSDIAAQVSSGSRALFGVMIESHLVEGRQDLVQGKELVYGQSVTDACIGWDDTESLLDQLAKAVQVRRRG